MALTLSIILWMVALICFLGGTNIMLKGAMHYLPKKHLYNWFWTTWFAFSPVYILVPDFFLCTLHGMWKA